MTTPVFPTLTNVTKQYGVTTAVRDVTLRAHPDQIHGLVGPNGSGKTTLFRLLATLVRPTTGHVDTGTVTVGYGFQHPRFYPALTVRENLRVFRGFAPDPPPTSWIDTLLDALQLDPVAHRRVDALSRGFKKKLDLALAFVTQPDLLLLDEPLTDVDDHSKAQIRSFLSEYQADSETRTIIVSTHDIAYLGELFDRLTVIVDGVIRFDEQPEADIESQYRAIIADQ